MFIKEVIIDGFKSYGTRTEVRGFDQQFNAITGLNGSGKSNILDAICFVLGITNLKQVRVSNLQGLVYKKGQAGVTKASVTVVFNNSDSKESPVGYEQYKEITVTRQIVIAGRNKYLINGHTAQSSQVNNLFQSVQLNVNNPHFLIMQGRITKVLNMKPPEILGMLEEAAGTRMFETKKQSALKTIEKKEIKVEEINSILAEQITPQLEKLRADKSHYLKYTANNAECERTERFCIAYKFVDAQKTLEKSAVELEKIQQQRSALETKIEEDEQAKEETQEQSEKVSAHKKEAMEGDFKKLEEEEKERSKVLVKFNSEWENKQQTVASEVEGKQALEAQATDITKSITKQNSKLEKLQSGYAALEKDVVTKTDELETNQQRLQDVAAGMAEAADGEEKTTIVEALAEAQRQASVSESEEKKMKMRITHLKGGKGDLDKRIKAAKKDVGSLESDFAKAKQDAEKLEAKVEKLGFNGDRNTHLVEEQQQLEHSNQGLLQTVDRLNSQLGALLNFQYQAPSGFDRSKVKGMVAKLISLNDPSTSTALEAAACGKLYQVVVDTVATGQTLLEKGKLRARVTIIPLDKISGRGIDPRKLEAAKKIAGPTARWRQHSRSSAVRRR